MDANLKLDFAIWMLKASLTVVFVWFGTLKLLNVSPVFDVISAAYPFITSHYVLYFCLAVLEIVLGICLLIPRFARLAGWVMVAHLVIATLGVLFSPQAFTSGFPLLSVVGEFVVKNFVLMAAALVVAFSG